MRARGGLCGAPRGETLSGFSRYQHSVDALPPAERAKVTRLAAAISSSFRRGCTPVVAVELVGHADRDPSRTREFIVGISRQRAEAVQAALARALTPPSLASRIAWRITPAGDSRLAVPNATSEPERARNRRVEVRFDARKPLPITVEELREVARRIELRLSDTELRTLQAGGTVSLKERPLGEFCSSMMTARSHYPDGNWPASTRHIAPQDKPRPSGCPRPPCGGVCFVISRKRNPSNTFVVCFCFGFFFVRLCGAFVNP